MFERLEMGLMTRLGILLAVLAVTCIPALARQPGTAEPTSGGVERGERLYIDYNCHYCHGTVGQDGLPNVGPRIARPARSLENFTAYVRRPTGRMSAYSDTVLSDAALADIYTYLRALPEAKPVGEIPLLSGLQRRPRQ